MLPEKLKGYRFPLEIIDYCIWSYHRFNDSYRDIQERLALVRPSVLKLAKIGKTNHSNC